MTAVSDKDTGQKADVEMVTGTIDGHHITVPKGTMIIRAAEQLGIEIPRFCDHPLLDPVAACRQCLIEVEGMPKPQPSCAIPLGDGMKVETQLVNEVADKAQKGVMEFLLTNHPLDCPMCDKGGECPLQNQAMSVGRTKSRYKLSKITFPKPVSISAEILFDQERCINCARCTRFADQIAGDPLIDLLDRGANQHPGVGEEPFDSYFSGNTIQICPVGALTSAEYRFRSRPFDLVSVPTTCEHCASGCSLRTDIRHQEVMRRYAWDDPEVNEEWNCDKGRFAFPYLSDNRLTQPLVREDGDLRIASWPEALRVAAKGLSQAEGRAAVLTGGRLTLEDAYAYSRFARVALNTDNIDCRARATSDEELGFLGRKIAGTAGPTYRDVEAAPAVLLIGLEPEDESPILFLRLRKAAQRGTKISAIAPFATEGLVKLLGSLIPAVPGSEAEALAGLTKDEIAAISAEGAVILLGERAAGMPGALTAAVSLAERTGASLGWVPRRAGERGAVDAGCLPGLLPGGRPLADEGARAQVAAAWGVATDDLPESVGLSTADILAAIAQDVAAAAELAESDETHVPQIGALVIAGVEAADDPNEAALLAAVRQAPFVVSMETRPTAITAEADVVFPVGVVTEKGGSFVNWEGRRRPFGPAKAQPTEFTDAVVLALISEYLDLPQAPRQIEALRAEIAELGAWSGERMRLKPPRVPDVSDKDDGSQTASLASWRQLLDLGVMQEGEPHLAATMRPSVARVSEATAAGIGVIDGEMLAISTDAGSLHLPLVTTEMPDGIVWVPFNSPQSRVTSSLSVAPGDSVRLSRSDERSNIAEGDEDA